jgi:hypothetical protein
MERVHGSPALVDFGISQEIRDRKYEGELTRSYLRESRLSFEELQKRAEEGEVGQIYKSLAEGCKPYFRSVRSTGTSLAFIGLIENSKRTIFRLLPLPSNAYSGLKFQVYIDLFTIYVGVNRDEAISFFPGLITKWEPFKGAPKGFEGFFKDLNEAQQFLFKLSLNLKFKLNR